MISEEGRLPIPAPDAGAFHLAQGVHYLNCAYMSPLLRGVEAAGIRGIRSKRAPHHIGPRDFFLDSNRVREQFSRLIGAGDPSRIAILPSASYGVAVAARNTGSVRGRNVVILKDQFPGNVYAWMRLTAEGGGELRMVEPPSGGVGSPGRGREWNQRLLEAVDGDTAVISVAPVHWTDGTRFDLEAVGVRAREVGALFVVDGTQSVGAIPFDVGRVQPDALICAAYKWLLGPYSMALGYFGPRFDGGVPLEEGWIARQGSEDFGGLVHYQEAYQPGALRYDVGERSNFILLPMLSEALRHLLVWTPEEIARSCGRLTTPAVGELLALGFRVEEAEWREPHILGVGMPEGGSVHRLREALEARNVQVSVRGESLRISPHVYNVAADMEALLDALTGKG
ncbi:MAG: aminotransferase class V-fold PLP-dependent enzyme [Gemmatimonadales bacterium]|nr:MAG: aminotransferase class V-fold PLP-dependent enzyme [Gemmatimonadales bacterium]